MDDELVITEADIEQMEPIEPATPPAPVVFAPVTYSTRYFIDSDGNYLGGYAGPDEDNPYIGALEISHPPENALDTWDGIKWNRAHIPNVDQLYIDLLSDSSLGGIGLPLLMSIKPLLNDYLPQGDLGQECIYRAWQSYIRPQLETVNPAFVAPFLRHAVANNIQMAPPDEAKKILENV